MEDLPRLIVTPVRRSEDFAAGSAIHAAAYRTGTALKHTDGSVVDFSHRTDIIHKEIVLPRQFDGNPDMWARNRQDLWTAAEHGDKWIENATLAREFLVWFPKELPTTALPDIARQFGKFLADRYHVAVDFGVHYEKGAAEGKLRHAHFLTTARQVTPDGLDRLAFSPKFFGRPLESGAWQSYDADLHEIRGKWGNMLNAALQAQQQKEEASRAAIGPDTDEQKAWQFSFKGAVARGFFAVRHALVRSGGSTRLVSVEPEIRGEDVGVRNLLSEQPAELNALMRKQYVVEEERHARGVDSDNPGGTYSELVRRVSVETWKALPRQDPVTRSASVAEHGGPQIGGRDHAEIS